MKAKALYTYCRNCGVPFLHTWLRHLYLLLTTKQNVVVGQDVSMDAKPMVNGRLMIGMDNSILSLPKSSTWIKNAGEFICKGIVDINRGCRIEVSEDARLVLDNCFINNNCLILCQHEMSVGSGTSIGWNTQICDEDYHEVVRCEYDVLRVVGGNIRQGIVIGKHVLLGNNCFIYKGVTIADGCVVASNSVVKKSLLKPNTLYAGNPAKEICEIQSWTS